MFYEPSTNTIYPTIQHFAADHPEAGELDTEAARNAAGLFTLRERPPDYDPARHTLHASGVAQDEQGRYAMQYTLTPLPPEQVRGNLLRAVSARRWAGETGGLTLPGGATVGTTIDDQNRITSVIANAQLAGVASVDFKAQSGWVTLSLDHMRGIAAAIALHVQACFSAERMHHEAISAASDAELYGYDIAAGWPDASPANVTGGATAP